MDVAASGGAQGARARGLHEADVAGAASGADDKAALDGGSGAGPGAGAKANAPPYAAVRGRAVSSVGLNPCT